MGNNRPQFVIAIDPGAKGAIACYSTSFEPPAEPSWTVAKLAETPLERFLQLEGYGTAASRLEAPRIAVLEEVSGFAGTAHPGSAMFKFGQNYGQLEGCLAGLGYKIIRIRPQTWQAGLSLKTRKGESKADHKRRMRAKALDLFPALKPTLDTADALLLLYFYIENEH